MQQWRVSALLLVLTIAAVLLFLYQSYKENTHKESILFFPSEGCKNKLEEELELLALRKRVYDLEIELESVTNQVSEMKMQEDTELDKFFVKSKSTFQYCETKSRLFQLKLPKIPLKLRSKHRIQVGPSQPLDCHEKNLKKHPELNELGKAIFYSEIKGQYETVSVISKYSAHGVYNLDFEVTLPGFYTVSTYIGISQLYSFQKFVIPANQIKAGIKKVPMHYCNEDVGKQEGRWVSCEDLVGDVTGMEECSIVEKNQAFDFDSFSKWRWLPYHCQVAQFSKSDIRSCAMDRKLKKMCFFGGLDMLFRMYHIHYRITEKECTECDVISSNKQIFAKDIELDFFWDPLLEKFLLAFGGNSDLAFQLVTSCDVILFNWGLDLLNSQNNSSYSYERYSAELETSLKNFKQKVDEKSTQLIWVNNYVASQRDLYPNLIYFNEAIGSLSILMRLIYLDALADKYGITRIDAFSISFGRILDSPDKRFFSTRVKGVGWGGSVETAVSNIIWHILCGEMFHPLNGQLFKSNSSIASEFVVNGDEALQELVANKQIFEEPKVL